MGAVVALAGAAQAAIAITPSDLSLVRYPDASTSFTHPINIQAPNDGTGRVFVVERCDTQGNGNTPAHIQVVKNGVKLATPFLTLNVSCVSEQGLLGLAFDPDFATNGTFYVTHTATSGQIGASKDQVLSRFTAPIGGDVANPTETVILRVPDIADNHNGGDLHFGPDGYLYWSMGDGGVQDDPNGFAQCTQRKHADSNPASCGTTSGGGTLYYLLGKIIRLDVHNVTASAPSNMCGVGTGAPAPYAIPPGNPFANVGAHPNDCAEIFNWGFRNPFRFSFDKQTGDMLIGDVGQNNFEEIDFQAAGSAGQNFQWATCEGFHTHPGGSTPCAGPAGSVPPKLEYTHSNGCAVIGGYVYRGPIQAFRGQYVFSDNCANTIRVVADPSGAITPWTYDTLAGTPGMGVYSFGEDADGNVYVADGSGNKVYRFHSDVIFQSGFDTTVN